MELVMTIVIMVTVGALIGGMTNSLAIKMLFWPSRPVYIFGRRLPFTPGLIPKRHNELALQLGRMVTNHLLTVEGVKERILDRMLRSKLETYVGNALDQWLSSNQSLAEVFDSFGIKSIETKSDAFVRGKVAHYYDEIIHHIEDKGLAEVLPAGIQTKVDDAIPVIVERLLQHGVTYFESEDGKSQLGTFIDRFLEQKGTLGNIVNMFMGNDSLVNRVQPEVIKFLKQPDTANWLTTLLEKEWGELKDKKVSALLDEVNHEDVKAWLNDKVQDLIHLEDQFQRPIGDVMASMKQPVLEKVVPHALDRVMTFLAKHVEKLLAELHLADIVESQVLSFSVARLEAMIMEISRREFKLITYLGAALGGLIGLVQAFFFLVL